LASERDGVHARKNKLRALQRRQVG
jgi:hypothetical protein